MCCQRIIIDQTTQRGRSIRLPTHRCELDTVKMVWSVVKPQNAQHYLQAV